MSPVPVPVTVWRRIQAHGSIVPGYGSRCRKISNPPEQASQRAGSETEHGTCGRQAGRADHGKRGNPDVTKSVSESAAQSTPAPRELEPQTQWGANSGQKWKILRGAGLGGGTACAEPTVLSAPECRVVTVATSLIMR